jgi:hypothetical protein
METLTTIKNLDRQIEKYRTIVREKEDRIDAETKEKNEEYLPYTEFVKKLEPELGVLLRLERYKRFFQPVTEWNELSEYGDVFSIEEFIEMCDEGGFIDYDGHGYYVKDGKESNVMVKPSDITSGYIRDNEFDSVIWFNK